MLVVSKFYLVFHQKLLKTFVYASETFGFLSELDLRDL